MYYGCKIDKLNETIDQLVYKISNMEQHIVEFEIEKKMDKIVEKKVNEGIHELIEKEKQKLNMIVVNLSERTKANSDRNKRYTASRMETKKT